MDGKIESSLLRITVRTLAIRFTDLALILVLSYVAPKAGSVCVRPHPTRAVRQSQHRYCVGGA